MTCKCNKQFMNLATFLAYIKHEIMIDYWINQTRSENSFFGHDLVSTYFLNNVSCYDTERNYISNVESSTNLDNLVHGFVNGLSLNLFIAKLEEYEAFDISDFWRNWTKCIFDMLNGFLNMPEESIDNQFRGGLHYAYTEQYEMMSQRIGVKEFTKILSWDKKKFSSYKSRGLIPMPIQLVGATPLWTVGQAEKFKLVLQNRLVNRLARGDWKTMISIQNKMMVTEKIF